jgi:hypothetical protein
MAASITTVVVLVAALTVGIAGALRADRALKSLQPPSPSVVAVAPPSPTPRPTQTGPIGPLPSAGVDCGLFAADICARMVADVSSLEGVPLASASLSYYSRNCVRTGECTATPLGDKPPVRLVGTTTEGGSVDWFCSQDPAAPNCAITPESDRQPVATLIVRFEGQKPGSISLRAANGGFSRSVSLSQEVLMTAGTYVLGSTIQCTDCPVGQPPRMCDARFDAPGGGKIDAVVNVTPGEACTINVSVAVAGIGTCSVTVSPSPARMGTTVRIEASGLTANGDGSGLADVRQDGKPVHLYFGPNGTFTRTFVAGRRLVGRHEVEILDSLSGCLARTTLTVIP